MKNYWLKQLSIDETKTPPIVQKAMERLVDKFSKPPEPVMSQEEYDLLPKNSLSKIMLVCNHIGCGKVVCTHGMVCVEHYNK